MRNIRSEPRIYTEAAKSFSFEEAARSLLSGDLRLGLNACFECCDRHASHALALRCIDNQGSLHEYSFAELREVSSKLAHLLSSQGIGAGDVVAGLLPRTMELVATVLAAWRVGAVYQPLFTAFGPKAIDHRIKLSRAKLIVTRGAQREKLNDLGDSVAVICVTGDDADRTSGTDIDFHTAIRGLPTTFEPVRRTGNDLLLMMATSGTTGLAKAVPVPLKALVAFGEYMRNGIGLQPSDVYWNIADPGWAYGLYYAVIGPLLLGHATTMYEGGFTVKSTYELIERLHVTSFAGSPTAFRLLMAAGADSARAVKGRLRTVSSAGEPLNAEVVTWFEKELAAPIRDHYGQTETGMVVNNHHGLVHAFKLGSAGLPMPGYRIVVIDEDGNELPPRTQGILAIDLEQSPLSWFTGYYEQENHFPKNRYYGTGDTVELDEDGAMFFVGRSDDVITSSGYRIGPFDVESALLEHKAVVEAAVIGVPDEERTELVKAYVVLAEGVVPSPELAEELSLHVKIRLSAHAYPRLVEFVEELPKTPSGKIQRFLLRQSSSAGSACR